MKIKINDIPKDGLELTESQDAGALDLARDDLRFVSPVDISAFISRDKDEVYARITAKGKLEITCARCLSPYRIDLKKDFDLSYDVKGKRILDLADDIRQEIILDYPMKIVCKPDCKGLCPNCGQNLNIAKCDCKKEED